MKWREGMGAVLPIYSEEAAAAPAMRPETNAQAR